ncbi:MAG: sensor histidine kinase [Acidimicrobiales bacterium]
MTSATSDAGLGRRDEQRPTGSQVEPREAGGPTGPPAAAETPRRERSAGTESVPVPGPSRWRVGRWMQRHPLLVDTLVAALVSTIAFGSYVATGHDRFQGKIAPRPVDALGFVLVALAAFPLAARRRHPLVAFGLILAGTAGYAVMAYGDSAVVLPLFIMMGTIGARFPRRRSLEALAVAELVMVPAYFVAATHFHNTPTAFTALVNGALLVVPWVFGENVRHRRQTFADAQERAVRAEQDRAAEAHRAVTEERSRIARELHDVVAHAMTVMVVQASAARRVLETSPDQRLQAIEALTHVESTGREGLAEMRRLLGVLRQEAGQGRGLETGQVTGVGSGVGSGAPRRGRPGPELAPQPRAHDLSALIRSWTDAGLEVELSVQGELDQLPPGIDLTAYRVVQEALTNTFKHAGPARARVSIVVAPSELQIEVVDDGRGAAATPPATPGHGLVGMHERVALYGGTVDTGPRAGGGYAVRARVPLQPTAP